MYSWSFFRNIGEFPKDRRPFPGNGEKSGEGLDKKKQNGHSVYKTKEYYFMIFISHTMRIKLS